MGVKYENQETTHTHQFMGSEKKRNISPIQPLSNILRGKK